MRVLIAGGGTGGHVIPALAIARELKASHNAEVLFVGTDRGMENRLVPQAGFGLMRVKVGALKNVSLITRMRTLFDLPRAVVDARKIINVFNPDVVVGVGGYASGPAMAAAILMHIPTLAFEPNYVPGFANKVVGHCVSAAAVHFEQTEKYFRNAQVVGVPVRGEFFNVPLARWQPSANAVDFWRQPGRASHQSGYGGRCSGSTTTNSPPPDHPPDRRA